MLQLQLLQLLQLDWRVESEAAGGGEVAHGGPGRPPDAGGDGRDLLDETGPISSPGAGHLARLLGQAGRVAAAVRVERQLAKQTRSLLSRLYTIDCQNRSHLTN